eukprot:2327688-Rhodomonas_salina.1
MMCLRFGHQSVSTATPLGNEESAQACSVRIACSAGFSPRNPVSRKHSADALIQCQETTAPMP